MLTGCALWPLCPAWLRPLRHSGRLDSMKEHFEHCVVIGAGLIWSLLLMHMYFTRKISHSGGLCACFGLLPAEALQGALVQAYVWFAGLQNMHTLCLPGMSCVHTCSCVPGAGVTMRQRVSCGDRSWR